MFGIGETELVLVLVFAFMIFGPDKLPGMGKTIGRALRQFRNAQEGFTQVVQTEIVDPATEAMSDAPKKKPNRKREEALDEDADIEGGSESAAAKRTETFAERKKRLEAERKAAEEAAAAEAAAATTDSSSDSDDGVDNAPVEPAAPAPAPAPEPEKPRTAADLYAMKRPSKPASSSDAAASTPDVATGDEKLAATREASDERSEERGASELLADSGDNAAAESAVPADSATPDAEKEA